MLMTMRHPPAPSKYAAIRRDQLGQDAVLDAVSAGLEAQLAPVRRLLQPAHPPGVNFWVFAVFGCAHAVEHNP